MEEIITINDKQYKIETSAPLTQLQINNVIKQLASNYSFVQGSVHQIIITASNGIAPYKYSITMDGVTKATNVLMPGTLITVPYTFNESVGTHILSASITDSCGTGILSNIDTSIITITANCTIPICEFTIS